MTESNHQATRPANMLMLQRLAGFQVSQALYVAAKLDVATVLAGGPRTVSEIAAEVNADLSVLTPRELEVLGLIADHSAFGGPFWTRVASLNNTLGNIGVAVIALFLVYTHRVNIARMRAGNESRIQRLWLFRSRAA